MKTKVKTANEVVLDPSIRARFEQTRVDYRSSRYSLRRLWFLPSCRNPLSAVFRLEFEGLLDSCDENFSGYC